MLARDILAVLSAVFLVAALVRAARSGAGHPQVRVWLLITGIFGLVSGWLFVRG